MPKLSVKLWGTLAQILCSSHLFQVAEAQQSAVARAKSISASLKFSSSFHASSPVARSFDNISGRTQAQAGQSATASVYLRLEDGLFFDQENRQINSSTTTRTNAHISTATVLEAGALLTRQMVTSSIKSQVCKSF